MFALVLFGELGKKFGSKSQEIFGELRSPKSTTERMRK
jgi:hypothetical protein